MQFKIFNVNLGLFWIFFYVAYFEYLNFSQPIINVCFPNVQDFNGKERCGQTGAAGDSLQG